MKNDAKPQPLDRVEATDDDCHVIIVYNGAVSEAWNETKARVFVDAELVRAFFNFQH